MKIPFSWLREFVDVPGTAADVAAALSLRGFAVEGLEPLDGGDAVIDVEVTANRPDCLCVAGIAREVATAFDLPLRPLPATAMLDAGGRDDVAIAIEAADLCPRYAGAIADVTGGLSPAWMQARLRAAGVRPIGAIVDVTNYVLLELGQPMHAFDLDRLAERRIVVRRAAAGESIRTLDGQPRTLQPDMLVIADARRPVAIAGVMGGADTEVTGSTTVILLESAYFDPRSVRRTSKALGMKTEASVRFERGADPSLPAIAMARACALIAQIGSGRARGTIVDVYPSSIEAHALTLRRARLEAMLGVTVPDDTVRGILQRLEFGIDERADGWQVTVPTRRVDVRREIDLIEEVARHYGYDRIPSTFPVLTAAAPRLDPRIGRARQLRASLTGAGFSEAVTFGFIGEDAAAPFAAGEPPVPIANPLAETFAVLRPSLLPGLVDAAAHNRRREQRDVRLFEIGARFSRSGGERQALGCLWTGAVGGDHWSGGTRPADFFDIKGACERVCDTLRVEGAVVPHDEPWLVPGRAAALMAGTSRIGVLGQLTPAVVERHGFPAGDAVWVAEIDLDAAAAVAAFGDATASDVAGGHIDSVTGTFGSAAATTEVVGVIASVTQTFGDVAVAPLPRHPSVTRDISIVVQDTLPANEVRRTIEEAAPATLARVREFDRYQGAGIPDEHVSLSLRLTFRAADRTLTDAEVQEAMQAILDALRERHGAVQR